MPKDDKPEGGAAKADESAGKGPAGALAEAAPIMDPGVPTVFANELLGWRPFGGMVSLVFAEGRADEDDLTKGHRHVVARIAMPQAAFDNMLNFLVEQRVKQAVAAAPAASNAVN